MKFVLIMMEKFRHLIVHKKGCAEDKDTFIDSVFKSLGLSKTDEYERYVQSFFGVNGYEKLIFLLETPAEPKELGAYHNNFQHITGLFLSYASYLTKCIKS